MIEETECCLNLNVHVEAKHYREYTRAYFMSVSQLHYFLREVHPCGNENTRSEISRSARIRAIALGSWSHLYACLVC